MRSNVDFDELWEGYHCSILDDPETKKYVQERERVQQEIHNSLPGVKQQKREALEYTSGVHTRSFRGSASAVEDAVDEFHGKMSEKYPNYAVQNVSAVQLADSTCLYVTFRV